VPPDTSVSERTSDTVSADSAVSAESGTSTPAISARGLTRTYGEVTAVDALDLTIHQGEIYGLLGPNGAGKSTTVKMLCTLLAPTGGQAEVAGFDIAARPKDVRLRIGVALQDVALDPKQTGLELLRLQGQLYGLRKGEIDQRLVELRTLVDLGDALERRISTYSGGMRRRLDLAASIVDRPPVLFLDEPTTGLDPASRLTVWEEVRRINKLGTTVFLTTQYLEEADRLCDRLAIIDDGLIVREGTPAELKAELRERRGLGSDPTLDDVFLDATGRTREHVEGDVQEVKA
jgi:ABC-2 type transport system ATP-binding protein